MSASKSAESGRIIEYSISHFLLFSSSYGQLERWDQVVQPHGVGVVVVVVLMVAAALRLE